MIRILKHCALGKPGRSISDPTHKQIAFAKRNPTIVRIIYDRANVPELVEPLTEDEMPVKIKMVDSVLPSDEPKPQKQVYKKKKGVSYE